MKFPFYVRLHCWHGLAYDNPSGYMPDFIFQEVSESTPGKRRKSAGRKKSSKSESEQDANTRNNVQEELVKTGTPLITSKLALKVKRLKF